MISIRKNVFETNSSSMHAITIGSNNEQIKQYNDTIVPFTINTDDDYSNWNHTELCTLEERAQYFWTTICVIYDWKHPDSCGAYNNFKDLDWCCPLSFNIVKNIVTKYLRGKCTFEDPNEIVKDDDDWYPIDHESINRGSWTLKLLLDKEKFLNYLFNPESVVYICSDGSWTEREYPKENNPMISVSEEVDDNISFDDYRKKSDAEYDRLYELGKKLGKKYKPRFVNKRKAKKESDFAKLYNAITDLKDDVHSILEYIENHYDEER